MKVGKFAKAFASPMFHSKTWFVTCKSWWTNCITVYEVLLADFANRLCWEMQELSNSCVWAI